MDQNRAVCAYNQQCDVGNLQSAFLAPSYVTSACLCSRPAANLFPQGTHSRAFCSFVFYLKFTFHREVERNPCEQFRSRRNSSVKCPEPFSPQAAWSIPSASI